MYNPSLGGPNFKPTTCVKLWLTILCYLKHKSGATARLSERVAMAEAQFVASVKAISPDNGGEFVRGIFPEPTTHNSSHENHVVERKASFNVSINADICENLYNYIDSPLPPDFSPPSSKTEDDGGTINNTHIQVAYVLDTPEAPVLAVPL